MVNDVDLVKKYTYIIESSNIHFRIKTGMTGLEA
jgi:hypothetical protein